MNDGEHEGKSNICSAITWIQEEGLAFCLPWEKFILLNSGSCRYEGIHRAVSIYLYGGISHRCAGGELGVQHYHALFSHRWLKAGQPLEGVYAC